MGLKCSKRPPIDWHSSMDESKAPRDKAFPSKPSCTKVFSSKGGEIVGTGAYQDIKSKKAVLGLSHDFLADFGVERKLRSIATPAKLN